MNSDYYAYEHGAFLDRNWLNGVGVTEEKGLSVMVMRMVHYYQYSQSSYLTLDWKLSSFLREERFLVPPGTLVFKLKVLCNNL